MSGIDVHHVDMEIIGSSRARRRPVPTLPDPGRVERGWWPRRKPKQPSHHDVIHFIANAERDVYGQVVSDSVRDHVEECLYDPYLIWRG
jgi:hypothetical protein